MSSSELHQNSIIMRNTTTLLVLLLSIFTLQAQDPNIQWQKTIGGNGTDYLRTMIETTDGGVLAGGYSGSDISGEKTENSRGGTDYWVIKLDADGSILWQKTYGGSGDDYLSSAVQTTDGGFIIGGASSSGISGDKTEDSRGEEDYWVLKLDPNGNIEWQKTYGGDLTDKLNSIVETNDDGYLLSGNSESSISGDRSVVQKGISDIWLIKINDSGAIVWQNSYGIALVQDERGLEKTSDGGFIISSSANFLDGRNQPFWILKIDAFGNQVWDRTIRGDKQDLFPQIKQTSDGGYIVAGISNSDFGSDKTENAINGSFDYWVLKLDENGNIIWQNTIGGAGQEGNVNALSQCEDGGYLIQGYSDSNISADKTENSNGSADFWFVKLNNVGIIEWQNTIGGEGTEIGGISIQKTDGDFLTGGTSNSNISGDKTENSRGGFDYWIIKHDSMLGIDENTFANAITIYPNPVKNILQINTQDKTIDQINIYSALGSRVRQLDIDTVSPTMDVSSLASGVYYVQLYSGKNVALKKFIKE